MDIDPDSPVQRKSFGKKFAKGKGGSSCHQCKSRRNFTALTYCTSILDSTKKKKCRKKFCGHCLKKFYKENQSQITDKSQWKCPSCRKICCCAACRRRKQKDLGCVMIDGKPLTRSDGGIVSPTAYLQAQLAITSQISSQLQSQLNAQQGRDSLPSLPSSSSTGSTSSTSSASSSSRPSLSTSFLSSNFLSTSSSSSSSSSSSFLNFPPISLPSSSSNLFSDDVPSVITTGMISPVVSPLPSPKDILNLDHLSGENDDEFDDRLHIPRAEVPKVLEAQIRDQAAKTARENGRNKQFEKLYAHALTPMMKRKIESILFRKDIPKSQKVDCIAQLLRMAPNS